MTTFDAEQPYLGEDPGERPRTSGMAITALVLSILGIVPCCGAITAVIGVILGIVGVATIRVGSNVRGRGLAMAAILIGLIFLIVQVAAGVWMYRTFSGPIMEGPSPALRAAAADDPMAFRATFRGAGATATDEEVEAFFNELESRYGDFVSAQYIGDRQQPGQPVYTGLYRVTFTNATVEMEADLVIVDEDTGELFPMDMHAIRVLDPDRGDLEFPPPSSPSQPGGAAEPPADEP